MTSLFPLLPESMLPLPRHHAAHAAPAASPDGGRHHKGAILARRTYNVGDFHCVELHDGRTKVVARLGPHYDAAADRAAPPDVVDWWAKASASVSRKYLNDQEGCCTISDAFHRVGLWTANDPDSGGEQQGTDAEVQQMYNAYKAGAGDSGCVPTDVLDNLKSRGLLVNGKWHKIDDYVAIDWTNQPLVMAAIETFGAIDLAIDLPGEWENNQTVWDVTNSGSVGGHSVPGGGYLKTAAATPAGVVISTWGGKRVMTWPAFTSRRYVTEAYVPLSPDWYNSDQLAPNGFNVVTLRDALAKIKAGVLPDVGPPPPPAPPPGPAPAAITLPFPIILPAGSYFVSGGMPPVG